MHAHFSALHAINVFLAILLLGTLWRLASLHLLASSSPMWQHVGAGMAFQY